MNPLERFKQAKKEVTEKLKECGTEVLAPMFVTWFEQNPLVQAVRWSQYTPYFNDGDACEFSVREPSVSIAGKQFQNDDGELSDFVDTWTLYDYRGGNKVYRKPEYEQLGKNIQTLFADLQEIEEVCERCFGDHQEITVRKTKTGKIKFSQEEYLHE